jgi:hypothetical protein
VEWAEWTTKSDSHASQKKSQQQPGPKGPGCFAFGEGERVEIKSIRLQVLICWDLGADFRNSSAPHPGGMLQALFHFSLPTGCHNP